MLIFAAVEQWGMQLYMVCNPVDGSGAKSH